MNLLPTLWDLTIRGSIIALVVFAGDLLAGRWAASRDRRRAWLLVPLAFLLPVWVTIPILPGPTTLSVAETPALQVPHPIMAGAAGILPRLSAEPFALAWALGALAGALVMMARTCRVSRRWDHVRFSTEAPLLEMLEDCRALVGVKVPVGLIVSDRIGAPVLLGWLRPKLLLPAAWTATCSQAQMRDVMLHELAHLRRGDLAWSWLFTAMRIVHWFNPLAHLAAARWRAAREDAADEQVLELRPHSPDSYEETLLTFAKCEVSSQPFGALGISESFRNLKHRITMIQNHPRRVVPSLATGLLLVLLGGSIFLRPTYAETPEPDQKAIVATAMQAWLGIIDHGDYAQSWTDASKGFRDAVTQDQWVAANKQVRSPLGACGKRELVSMAFQDGIPSGSKKIPGTYAIAQFKASFANLFSAIETVTFQKEGGSWKAAGYYIKPAM